MTKSVQIDKEKQLEQRITALETTVAFLDDTVEQLNNVLSKQDIELGQQKRMLTMLVDKFIKTDNESDIEHFDVIADRPPHY